MKAEELMIGDWILAEGKPVKVTNISVLGGDIIRVISPFMSYDVVYASNIVALSKGAKDINMIEPIPLTTEILEKNGFEHEDGVGYVYDDYETSNKVIIDMWDWTIKLLHNYDIAFNCTYRRTVNVHELQHILKDLEIEKEIVL